VTIRLNGVCVLFKWIQTWRISTINVFNLTEIGTVMFKIVLVNGQSMIPTLQNGERVLAWIPFARRFFKRGAIVTLSHFHIHLPAGKQNHPGFRAATAAIAQEQSELFIKRLVGLPGDTVRIPLSQLSPHSLVTVDPRAARRSDELVWHVPAGYVFVRGDGQVSNDSVAWGPIPFEKLDQIVLCRFPSFQRIP
jgi:signal peptidase I